MSIHENISDTSSSSWTGDAENPVINEEPNPLEEVKALAEKETKRMRFWKFFVVIAILFTGGVVSTGIYVFLTEQRSEGFYNKVSRLSGRTEDSLRWSSLDDSFPFSVLAPYKYTR